MDNLKKVLTNSSRQELSGNLQKYTNVVKGKNHLKSFELVRLSPYCRIPIKVLSSRRRKRDPELLPATRKLRRNEWESQGPNSSNGSFDKS